MKNWKGCDYLFYHVIGPHGKEGPESIVPRKQGEIKNCGMTLWAAAVDKKSKEMAQKLGKKNNVYVLCKISSSAKDPATGDNWTAKNRIMPDGTKVPVPKGVICGYKKGKKNYQAYVVEKCECLEVQEDYDFGPYVSTMSKGTQESFTERFKQSRFQNTFGKKDGIKRPACKRPISVVLKLKWPFVVDIEP